MPDIANVILLDTGYFYTTKNILEFCSKMPLEITWKPSVPLRACFYDVLGRSKALLSLGQLILLYEGKSLSEYSPQGPMTQKKDYSLWALGTVSYNLYQWFIMAFG